MPTSLAILNTDPKTLSLTASDLNNAKKTVFQGDLGPGVTSKPFQVAVDRVTGLFSVAISGSVAGSAPKNLGSASGHPGDRVDVNSTTVSVSHPAR
jgi:hypothetical protein